MASAKLTSKGQITIPQEVRQRMGVSAGDRIDFVQMEDGAFAMKPATQSVRELRGIIPLRRKPATLEEMQAAVVAGATKGLTPRRAKKK
ncbi:MAG: AbrB/MazE/SpoVT family DNA-binding domain-containing protein [Alphaproteobacteria bacterium]